MTTWEPRPMPEVTPETEQFWQAAADGEFLLSECNDCELVFFYPRSLCPDCFGSTSWKPAEGTGVVYTYSVSSHVPNWPKEDLPLINAYIELNEGPRVMSNVTNASPDEVDVGTRVTVDFIPTEDGSIAIPVFTPTL